MRHLLYLAIGFLLTVIETLNRRVIGMLYAGIRQESVESLKRGNSQA
jgi:hypothetical protein